MRAFFTIRFAVATHWACASDIGNSLVQLEPAWKWNQPKYSHSNFVVSLRDSPITLIYLLVLQLLNDIIWVLTVIVDVLFSYSPHNNDNIIRPKRKSHFESHMLHMHVDVIEKYRDFWAFIIGQLSTIVVSICSLSCRTSFNHFLNTFSVSFFGCVAIVMSDNQRSHIH